MQKRCRGFDLSSDSRLTCLQTLFLKIFLKNDSSDDYNFYSKKRGVSPYAGKIPAAVFSIESLIPVLES